MSNCTRFLLLVLLSAVSAGRVYPAISINEATFLPNNVVWKLRFNQVIVLPKPSSSKPQGAEPRNSVPGLRTAIDNPPRTVPQASFAASFSLVIRKTGQQVRAAAVGVGTLGLAGAAASSSGRRKNTCAIAFAGEQGETATGLNCDGEELVTPDGDPWAVADAKAAEVLPAAAACAGADEGRCESYGFGVELGRGALRDLLQASAQATIANPCAIAAAFAVDAAAFRGSRTQGFAAIDSVDPACKEVEQSAREGRWTRRQEEGDPEPMAMAVTSSEGNASMAHITFPPTDDVLPPETMPPPLTEPGSAEGVERQVDDSEPTRCDELKQALADVEIYFQKLPTCIPMELASPAEMRTCLQALNASSTIRRLRRAARRVAVSLSRTDKEDPLECLVDVVNSS